jgi:hypothetical protein
VFRSGGAKAGQEVQDSGSEGSSRRVNGLSSVLERTVENFHQSVLARVVDTLVDVVDVFGPEEIFELVALEVRSVI